MIGQRLPFDLMGNRSLSYGREEGLCRLGHHRIRVVAQGPQIYDRVRSPNVGQNLSSKISRRNVIAIRPSYRVAHPGVPGDAQESFDLRGFSFNAVRAPQVRRGGGGSGWRRSCSRGDVASAAHALRRFGERLGRRSRNHCRRRTRRLTSRRPRLFTGGISSGDLFLQKRELLLVVFPILTAHVSIAIAGPSIYHRPGGLTVARAFVGG